MLVLEGGAGLGAGGWWKGLEVHWEAGAIREDFSEELTWKAVRTSSPSDRGPGIPAEEDKRRKLCH